MTNEQSRAILYYYMYPTNIKIRIVGGLSPISDLPSSQCLRSQGRRGRPQAAALSPKSGDGDKAVVGESTILTVPVPPWVAASRQPSLSPVQSQVMGIVRWVNPELTVPVPPWASRH